MGAVEGTCGGELACGVEGACAEEFACGGKGVDPEEDEVDVPKVSSTMVKSSPVATSEVPGTGTCAPSEGATGVSGEVTCAGGASSMT
eukprot:11027531-Alexandrium_andersonii.AAC.1